MYTTVGRLSSYISQGVYTVSGPFHPFGGAVDIVVVEQPDGSYKSSPWYVKFGKFQGVLKRREKTVVVSVNDVEANFHMYLDHKGEAYFLEDASDDDEKLPFSPPSGPSSGDEGHELALEYHKSGLVAEQGDGTGNESSSDGEEGVVLNSSESLELQFPGDESSVAGGVHGDGATSKFDELLDEAVGIERDEEAAGRRPAAALFANSALMALERVAEKPVENGVMNGEVSSSGEKEEEHSSVTSVGSRNGEYVINSYEVARAIEKTFVITGPSKEEVELKAKELEKKVAEPALVSEDVLLENASSNGVAKDEAVCVTDVKTSLELEAVDDHMKENQEEDEAKDFATSSGKSVVHLEGCSPPSETSENASLTNITGKEPEKVDEAVEEVVADTTPNGMVIEEVPPEESSLEATSSTNAIVTEPAEAVGEEQGKDTISDPVEETETTAAATAQEKRAWGWWTWSRGSSKPKLDSTATSKVKVDGEEVAESGKESIVSSKVLSSAEVVLMSVDGHVVVAEQDEATPPNDAQLQELQSGAVQVLEKEILESTELKSGPETAIEISSEHKILATEAALHNSIATGLIRSGYWTPWKFNSNKTLTPTSEQLASLNLKRGRNKITFTYTTRVLGKQQVDARIYLWKWNTKAVISDVDGTITKSDVLGQVMPLVGRDWTQIGVARLFSAIKDNGYELIFLSARAIAQAYLTRQFLVNLKQDGAALPDGPVVISPDGLFPSLYREVIRRAPHEFKIGCLEDIRALFPSECQPFYAGFGNRDTDEISYLKVGIPKGKIFIINPKGEVIVNNILDLKSYTSLHKLVNDMFPPVNLTEREDFNSWNFWKMPLPDIDEV